MSMAEVIKSIEREALREAQSHEIGGRNGEPIETSEFHDMTIANSEGKKRDYEISKHNALR